MFKFHKVDFHEKFFSPIKIDANMLNNLVRIVMYVFNRNVNFTCIYVLINLFYICNDII